MTKSDGLPWSVPVAIHDVPEAGRHFELAADQDTRAAVAEAIGVPAVLNLTATFDVTPDGRDGLRVEGQVVATVEQSCVVTLEPVQCVVEEAVNLMYVPQIAVPTTSDGDRGGGKRVAADEAAEPMPGDSIDLGAIAVEFLILGIDPYPRKSGVVFEAPVADNPGANPFAALAALKKNHP